MRLNFIMEFIHYFLQHIAKKCNLKYWNIVLCMQSSYFSYLNLSDNAFSNLEMTKFKQTAIGHYENSKRAISYAPEITKKCQKRQIFEKKWKRTDCTKQQNFFVLWVTENQREDDELFLVKIHTALNTWIM